MYIYLDIIKEFSCEMCGQCCRNQWQVTLDEECYNRNYHLFLRTGRMDEFSKAFIPVTGKGELGEYAYISKKPEGGCWFLGESNLCQLQKEAGHDHLDTVCRIFPRYPMDTSRGTELTLSFSCPKVIKLASRLKPLEFIRSKNSPILFCAGQEAVYVYPGQQSISSPLYYYFEIEYHFIDILQKRELMMSRRLQLLRNTISLIQSLQQDNTFAQELSAIIHANYELLDQETDMPESIELNVPDILIENFFVNFVFKKPFYLYGLVRGMQLLDAMWIQLERAGRTGIKQVSSMVMELEFQYSHNRRGLLQSEKRSG